MKTSQGVINACTRAAHEAIRAYCIATDDDASVPPWEHADTEYRESLEGNVRRMLEAGVSPRLNHESWLRTMLANGWEYGPTKDDEKKTHPRIMVYDALPTAQRTMDALLVDVVLAMAAALNFTPVLGPER